ncbi:MAG: fluoride efflux transporter CrcB [Alphaproteobacteria bacterium]|nr:fluoride efflux transporter CrcB [Alphaproteobacteria bacterium]
MGTVFAIALGGALGAVGRYALSSQVTQWMGAGFPWGILLVNVVGCFVMGVIVELSAVSLNLSPEMRAFLTTGILGGFTTFSAFALDTAVLVERGDMASAAAYVAASVLGSIAALFLGLALVRGLA